MKPKLKLCGNRSLEDWKLVRESHANYAGFIFANSPRRVEQSQVGKWLADYPPTGMKIVAVFVNPDLEEIADTVSSVPIDIIQLHGNENAAFATKIKQMTGKEIWKVIHHHNGAKEEMANFACIAEGYVIDTKLPGQWGGTGKRFDWESIPSYKEVAEKQGVPLFVAGGINADNVSELLEYHPDGIDVSSGIERNGGKHYDKIQKLQERLC
ncbi:phosphoribosylanthranilate isomerase [Guptibacillus algicola]|uniref:phosphoribosylanthranilate isomerase n=1 Tax=Guptibacillus algicola TaxID=225844 RepID=UPI001CD57020|nr:phosphoribosylanthranilate isomerase [Alkalihalobacillus algicola]MCA0985778.1 phosphoribosylanthranilate isomerase [Alkalihalobacillus algicola]